MDRGEALIGSAHGYTYWTRVPANRDAGDYTARLVPSRAGAAVPLEASQILWQR